MKRLVIAFALLATACGGHPEWRGDPELYGIDLVVASRAEYAAAPDLRPRAKRLAGMTAQLAGRDPDTAFQGLRVVLVDGELGPGRCGLYVANDLTAYVQADVYPSAPCIEWTVFAHELLHHLIGDPSHGSPLWQDVSRFRDDIPGACGHVANAYPWPPTTPSAS